MDCVITGLERRKNILITNLKGFDRSRFLLKTELHLLLNSKNFYGNTGSNGANNCLAPLNGTSTSAYNSMEPATQQQQHQQQHQHQHLSSTSSFKRIYHVVDSDELIRKIYIETSQMPFGDFNLSVAKLYSNQTGSLLYQSDSRQIQRIAPLIVCHMRFLFDELAARDMQIDTSDAIIVFDGIALEKIEDYCCKLELGLRRQGADGLRSPPTTDLQAHPLNKKRMLEQPQQRPSVIRLDSSATVNSGSVILRGFSNQAPTVITANGISTTALGAAAAASGRHDTDTIPPIDDDRSSSQSAPLSPCLYLPRFGFRQATADNWSILLACNPPVDGLNHELGYKFECCTSLVSGYHQQQLPHTSTFNNYRIFSSILTTGHEDSEIFYITKNPYNEIARTVRECLQRLSSGKAVVMFREFKLIADYYAKWCELGTFDKIGYALFVDTGLPSQTSRKVLIDFHRHQGNALLLTSHSFNDNIGLTEYVFSSVKMMIVLGLPRPAGMGGDKWRERTDYSNRRYFEKYPSTALNGYDLIYYRGLETLNGTIRKCLGEYRWTDCAILIVAPWVAQAANKLTSELADIRQEKFAEAMERFDKFCNM